eukprot:515088-Pleurochrysis_carterae.AAC.1
MADSSHCISGECGLYPPPSQQGAQATASQPPRYTQSSPRGCGWWVGGTEQHARTHWRRYASMRQQGTFPPRRGM